MDGTMEAPMLYDVSRNTTPAEYFCILDFCAKRASKFLLIVRDQLDLDASGQQTIDELEPFLLDKQRGTEWPGTQLLGHEATLFRYEAREGALDVLKRKTNSFYGWQQPNLPEDLCFLRERDEPLWITIAHEEDCYCKLLPDEKGELDRLIPGLLTPTPDIA